MQLLTEMHHPPTYLFVENVQGFELSNTREHFVTILKRLGYEFQEFLISPVQFGIPNSRLRFYLLAKRSPFALGFSEQPCRDVRELLRSSELSADSPGTSLHARIPNSQDSNGKTVPDLSQDVFSEPRISPNHEKQVTQVHSSVESAAGSLQGMPVITRTGACMSSLRKNYATSATLQPQAEGSGASFVSPPITETTRRVEPLLSYLAPPHGCRVRAVFGAREDFDEIRNWV